MTLVRSSNEAVEKGRSPCRRVFGDRAFVENVIKESKARQLRISRFKHEGGDFTTLAKCIAKAALVSVDDLHRRHRGGPDSDAGKCFCYTATRKYGTTATAVADCLGIHSTAVSAMVCKGKQLAEKIGL